VHVSGPALELRDVSKSYGGVQALANVSISLLPGEVVGLVGDNGAGKSTLVKVASGVVQPDQGSMYIDGEPVHIKGPADAAAAGIAVIYQDLALSDNLNVPANLFLGRELAPLSQLGFLDEATMEKMARELLSELNVGAIRNLNIPVGRLSGGQRQTIAIARSLLGHPQVVLLDEPTAALGVPQSQQVLLTVRKLATRGLALMMISHNIADVFNVCDRIVVLRLGRIVADLRTPETTPEAVVAAITGAAAPSSPTGSVTS
jgi:D-xylose transport system ATP-binding protein